MGAKRFRMGLTATPGKKNYLVLKTAVIPIVIKPRPYNTQACIHGKKKKFI